MNIPAIIRNFFRRALDTTPRQVSSSFRHLISDAQRPDAFDCTHPCVWVLSTGRTGTQTLAALFALARNVQAFHEPHPRLYALSRIAYQYAHSREVCEALAAAFIVGRQKQMDDALRCDLGYVETSPQETFLAPIIRELVPQSRFIHLIRDPRAVVRSGMRRQWYAGNPADSTRIVPLSGSKASVYWQDWSPFQKNLWLWAETNRWIVDFISRLPCEQTLSIHSEHLFDLDPNTLIRLYDFVGVSVPPFRKVKRVINKRLNIQKTGDFAPFSEWSALMCQQMNDMCGPTAQQLGYTL